MASGFMLGVVFAHRSGHLSPRIACHHHELQLAWSMQASTLNVLTFIKKKTTLNVV
jgi:hypothetical protein